LTISDACQLWVEQRICEELELQSHTGKSLLAIGKDIAKEIERLFDAKINADTLRKRAGRMSWTNVQPQATNQEDSEITENQSLKEEIKAEPRKHIATGKPEGGSRKGAGRKPKYTPQPVSDAMDFAVIAISQLERINKDDPHREDAFDEVQRWINEHRRKIR
jgi:hypothetical protein